MAVSRVPRFKLSRRLGVNVFGHPKAMNRVEKNKVRTNKKLSEYGMQLREKQKIKAYYGILERQFRRYLKNAIKSSTMTGTALIVSLECRLDNLVYRMGFASSSRQARQMVNHGHILVNGKRVDIPSCGVKTGDVISLKEASRKNEIFVDNFQTINSGLPYIQKDTEKFSATLTREPQREEIPIDVNEILAVELYSK